jgi:type I restriction enzyme, S subunit
LNHFYYTIFPATDFASSTLSPGLFVQPLEHGDLLLEKSGGGELQPVGTVVLYDLDTVAVCSNFIARMPAAKGFDPVFLCYLHSVLYSARLNTRSIKQNTGIQNLDSYAYLCEKVPLPTLPEQYSISAYLDRETAKIDALVSRIGEGIEKLKEYSTALILAAVTGKIDVRDDILSMDEISS